MHGKQASLWLTLSILLVTLVACDEAALAGLPISTVANNSPAELIPAPPTNLIALSGAATDQFKAAVAKSEQFSSFHFTLTHTFEQWPYSMRDQGPLTTTVQTLEGDALLDGGSLQAVRYVVSGDFAEENGEWRVFYNRAVPFNPTLYHKTAAAWQRVDKAPRFSPLVSPVPIRIQQIVSLLNGVPTVVAGESQQAGGQLCNYYLRFTTYGSYYGYWISQQDDSIVQLVDVGRDGGERPSSVDSATPLTDVGSLMTISKVNVPLAIEQPN